MPEFVFFMRADANSEAGVANHPTEAFEAMTKYNEALNDAGVLLSGEALAPTSQDAYTLKFDAGGNAESVQGPFDVASETHITGFWIVKTETTEEALEWAKKSSVPGAQVYFRRIVNPSELGAGYTPELKQRDAKVREDAAGRSRAVGK
ncbi:hypothetical protein HJFPF1_04550 [Paramyrothecium foliicola]|nr:hypothetical protein HJFPF1_04550 [Paramyrothecium foliicola]